MATEEGVPVDLYIYDLTHGLASVFSANILGRQVDGVWHTAIVVYDREYFYGAHGVTSCAPGGTQLGQPHKIERLGTTFVPFQMFLDYIQALATTTFTGAEYRLLEHNCNHFSDEVAQFLCGARVPKHILQQPEALPPPLRQALTALLDNLTPHADQAVYAAGVRHARQDSPDFHTLNDQIEEARCQCACACAQCRCDGAAQRRGCDRAAGPGRPPRDGLLRRSAAVAGWLARTGLLLVTPAPLSGLLSSIDRDARVASAALEARRSTLAEKLARKERRRDKRKKKQLANGHASGDADLDEMAEAVDVAPAVSEQLAGPSTDALMDADERRQEEERRRSRDPPIIYRDIDGAAEFEKLSAALEGVSLSPEEKQSLDELQQYLVHGEGSWVLGDDFLAFFGRLLNDDSVSSEARAAALRCLAASALRDDVSLVLHQDRRHHALLSYAHRIDLLPLPEQIATALFMCNLFENISSSEWLMYISEWESAGQPLSNIRATTKVCVHALLAEDPTLRDLGTALMHNVATKERLSTGRKLRDLLPKKAKSKVFDEVCVELGMALLQLLQWAPAEEHLFRAVKALARLAHHSAEVPQLIAMVGPDPTAFRGTSPRVDEQIDLIMKKVK